MTIYIDLNVNFGYGGIADLRDDDTMCCRQILVIPHSTVEYTDLCLREWERILYYSMLFIAAEIPVTGFTAVRYGFDVLYTEVVKNRRV